MKKSKGWSGSSIRKLARQRVQAEIEGAQKASLTSSCSDDVNFASRKGFKATPPNNASPEFLWGRFEKSYGDNVLIVVLDTLLELCNLYNYLAIFRVKAFSILRVSDAN